MHLLKILGGFVVSSLLIINGQSKNVKVVFYIDGIKQEISKDKILFIRRIDTLVGKIDANGFLVFPPDMHDEKHNVVFQHGVDTLTFKNIEAVMLKPNQNYEWCFGIDNRPFDNLLGILPYNEYLTDTITRKLKYWHFSPQEEGDGIQIYYKEN
jgi:hypothetical protein